MNVRYMKLQLHERFVQATIDEEHHSAEEKVNKLEKVQPEENQQPEQGQNTTQLV